jgi:hypothetical protein
MSLTGVRSLTATAARHTEVGYAGKGHAPKSTWESRQAYRSHCCSSWSLLTQAVTHQMITPSEKMSHLVVMPPTLTSNDSGA